MARARRSFGYLRKLPSGRWQASYLDPSSGKRINAPTTFTAKTDADTWLSIQRAGIETGAWRGSDDKITLEGFADRWFSTYNVGPHTYYRTHSIYTRWVRPTFGAMPMSTVTTPMVRQWVGAFPKDHPHARAEAYKVLKRLFRDAVSDRIITVSPVNIPSATVAPAHREGHALTPAEVESLAAKMPRERRLAVRLAAYAALRPGEVLALRARDMDQKNHLLHVRETASIAVKDVPQVRAPKTPGSVRSVNYPSELHDAVDRQLREYATPGPRGHLFPSPVDDDRPVGIATFRSDVKAAAKAAKIDNFKPHDLRHSGLTMAAGTGATVAELMARAGHTSPTVAAKYQHAVRERDRAIADALGAAITKDDEGDDDAEN